MSENDSNIITLKLKYSTDENSKTQILEYIKNYNNVLHFTYNRLHENEDLKTKEITVLQKTMNNVFIDSHFKNSAIFDSKSFGHCFIPKEAAYEIRFTESDRKDKK